MHHAQVTLGTTLAGVLAALRTTGSVNAGPPSPEDAGVDAHAVQGDHDKTRVPEELNQAIADEGELPGRRRARSFMTRYDSSRR
jgi:hypothetical protein